MRLFKPISEEKLVFLIKYLEVLEAINEGLRLADESYQEQNYGSGNTLINNITNAFISCNALNMRLRDHENDRLLQQLDHFQDLIEQVLHLQSLSLEEKANLVHEFFRPKYQQWHVQIKTLLEVYIYH